MTDMLPHASYKPSTAPWIGQMPAHWDEKPLFAVAVQRREQNTGMREKNLLSLSYGRIVRKDINASEGLLPESFETYQIVRPGDVIFRLTDLQNDKRSLRSAICDEQGIITSAYVAVVPGGIAPKFFNYLMRAYDVQKVFYSMGGGLRQSLKYDDLRRMPILLPNADEQQEIVEFLDRQTARVDVLIERKRKFINLLQEKRASCISAAVTKGIGRANDFQDSGLKSIGNVPSHWAMSPVGRALRQTKRIVGDKHDNYKLLSLTTRGVIERDTSDNSGKFPESFETYQEVRPGQFVFCLFDMDETPRTVGCSERHGMITGAYAVFDGIEPAYSRYLLYLFLHLDTCKGLKPHYTGLRKTIRPTKFTSIRIPFPPAAEAAAIARYLDETTKRIDTLVAQTERSIELLKEHRSALITAAVTGKIDVRGLAAKNMKAAA